MDALLDPPEVRRRFSRLSVEEYHRLDEFNQNGKRTELIRGIVVEKPRKTPAHSTIVARLHHTIDAQLREGYSIRQHDPLTLRDSELEPDLAVVRGMETDFRDAHPKSAALVIEMAADIPELDGEIACIYAESEVAECWFIHSKTRTVEVYRRPTGGGYQERTAAAADASLTSSGVPGLYVLFTEIFAGLAAWA